MSASHSIPCTAVSQDVIYCEGKILAEMTDGTLLQFSVDRCPDSRDLAHYGMRGFKYKTKDELIRLIGDINREVRLKNNDLLRMDKIRRLGWDHEQRGY